MPRGCKIPNEMIRGSGFGKIQDKRLGDSRDQVGDSGLEDRGFRIFRVGDGNFGIGLWRKLRIKTQDEKFMRGEFAFAFGGSKMKPKPLLGC